LTPSDTDGTSAKQSVEALYDYTASPDIPFLPDPRMELSMKRGDVFQLIHRREEDGWCLVITSTTSGEGATEGWVSRCVAYRCVLSLHLLAWH
jgi:hypothetical protein